MSLCFSSFEALLNPKKLEAFIKEKLPQTQPSLSQTVAAGFLRINLAQADFGHQRLPALPCGPGHWRNV